MPDKSQGDFRAGRELRIRSGREFDRLFRLGLRASDGRLMLLMLPREGGGPTRFGMAVSTRHGNAVRRNRIRRLCREACRLTRGELPAGRDYILVPRVGAEADLDGLRESLRKLAARLEEQVGREARPS